MSRFTFIFTKEHFRIRAMVHRKNNFDETYFGEELRMDEVQALRWKWDGMKVYTLESMAQPQRDQIGGVWDWDEDKEGNIWVTVGLFPNHPYVKNKIKSGKFRGLCLYRKMRQNEGSVDIIGIDELAFTVSDSPRKGMPEFEILPELKKEPKKLEWSDITAMVTVAFFILLGAAMKFGRYQELQQLKCGGENG